jgi:formylglycine-generating enzyme required for sulfatase activity
MRIIVALCIAGACSSKGSQREPVRTDASREQRADPASDAALEVGLEIRLDKLEPPGPTPKPIRRKHRSGDCSTKYAPRPDRDPNPMCRIPGGSFAMGGSIADPPPHVVSSQPTPTRTSVRDFDIDQFEVTAAQAARFLNAHGNECPGLHARVASKKTPCVWLESGRDPIDEHDGEFVVLPNRGEFVVWNFSIEGAMRYCAWVGKQLATSAQWEYAARHDPRTGRDLIYPWGDTWKANRTCTTHEDCAREWKQFKTVGIAGLFDGTRGRGDGSSPFGVHDTLEAGNEYVTVCDDPNATCRPGRPCPCQIVSTPSGQFDVRTTTTYARLIEPTDGAARCVVPR